MSCPAQTDSHESVLENKDLESPLADKVFLESSTSSPDLSCLDRLDKCLRSPAGVVKSTSFTDIETVDIPDDPRLYDIYTLNPKSTYHELPSLVGSEMYSPVLTKMASAVPQKADDRKDSMTVSQEKLPVGASMEGDAGSSKHKNISVSFINVGHPTDRNIDVSDRDRVSPFLNIDLSFFKEEGGRAINQEFLENITSGDTSSSVLLSCDNRESFLASNIETREDLGLPTPFSSEAASDVFQNERFIATPPVVVSSAEEKEDEINPHNVSIVLNDGKDLTPQDIFELSESWVDLSKSNPSTPPHPLQQQTSSPARAAPASSPASPRPPHSPALDLPPPRPHSTHASNPFVIPTTVDRHSSHSPPASSSLAEQCDRLGPLGGAAPMGFGNGEEYLRLLREAQRDNSCHSSARVSLASSRRDSLRGSPKSPPNSPNTEPVGESTTTNLDQLGAVYINYYGRADDSYVRLERNTDTDWIWDWSSRPDQHPPKEWRFGHPGSSVSSGGSSSLPAPVLPKTRRGGALSLRTVRLGHSALFSRDVLYTLLLSNVLSLLLGTGIGVWLSRRSGNTVAMATLPFN